MSANALAIILLSLVILLATGVPIAFSIGIASIITILTTMPADVCNLTAAQRAFVGIAPLPTAIPFFILAGNLMNEEE